MQNRGSLPLTIFTPAYNRCTELKRLYSSLCAQTDKRFEWLIVDDGSADGTCELITGCAQNAPFTVRYIRQENCGKHVAHNRGAAEAAGRYFMCVDSDDWLESNAVETILRDSIALDEEEGLLYPRLFSTEEALGTWFPDGVDKIELAEMRMKYGLVVETAIVFNTEVLRRHPFPVVRGEHFMPEGSSYYSFVVPELFFVRNEPFYRCEYLDEGLTRNIWKNWLNNPVGTRMALVKRYEAADRYAGVRALRERVAAAVGIESINIALGKSLTTDLPCSLIWAALLSPIGYCVSKKRFKDSYRDE